MKVIKVNSGFTLVEILIGMNLSFLVFTILVSTFLLLGNFINTSTKKLEARREQNLMLHILDELFYKTSAFSISHSFKDSITTIEFSDSKILQLLNNEISINGEKYLANIQSYSLTINTELEQIKIGSRSNLNYVYSELLDSNISSNSIVSLSIEINFPKKKYSRYFKPNQFSINRFKDIHKKNA
ncbi:MAG: hypothetical protein HND52_19695 [Ignavibacteriae bacterium]|nr:hypothetical protein [Ignavibacteriota bacterium]NOH00192.1 hypothetical protein [Ignavibacteriota bacterium]